LAVNCLAINWPGGVRVVLSQHVGIGMAEHVGISSSGTPVAEMSEAAKRRNSLGDQ
jgi:hypothetical protein